jgi:hypothetical protein
MQNLNIYKFIKYGILSRGMARPGLRYRVRQREPSGDYMISSVGKLFLWVVATTPLALMKLRGNKWAKSSR